VNELNSQPAFSRHSYWAAKLWDGERGRKKQLIRKLHKLASISFLKRQKGEIELHTLSLYTSIC
jgi:hypothetical protein